MKSNRQSTVELTNPMSLQGVKHVLKKCPPLFRAAVAVQSTSRALFGPAWLQRQIRRQIALGNPLRIVIGSSQVYDDGWIPTNMQYLNLLVDEHWTRAFHDQPIDAMLAEHVWEHLSTIEGRIAAAQCFRHLRPGGYLRIAVPDGYHPVPEYIEFVRPGGYGPGAIDHKALYTIDSLSAMLGDVGFDVLPLEHFDSAGVFHRAEWDPADGRVVRCKGWTETDRANHRMQFTSLIVDARKPSGTATLL